MLWSPKVKARLPPAHCYNLTTKKLAICEPHWILNPVRKSNTYGYYLVWDLNDMIRISAFRNCSLNFSTPTNRAGALHGIGKHLQENGRKFTRSHTQTPIPNDNQKLRQTTTFQLFTLLNKSNVPKTKILCIYGYFHNSGTGTPPVATPRTPSRRQVRRWVANATPSWRPSHPPLEHSNCGHVLTDFLEEKNVCFQLRRQQGSIIDYNVYDKVILGVVSGKRYLSLSSLLAARFGPSNSCDTHPHPMANKPRSRMVRARVHPRRVSIESCEFWVR